MSTVVKRKLKSEYPSGFHGYHIPENSVWNLWRDGVTTSFLNSFLTCLEQTRLTYVEGWSSRSVPMAFEFGTCVHWMLEQAYGLLTVPSSETIQNWVKRYEIQWKSQVKDPTSRQLEQQELVYGMAEAVLPGYFARWDGDFNGGTYTHPNQTVSPKQWVSLEEVFSTPYTFPDGKQIPFRGRRDGLFRDKRGKLWVFDTKCRSVINHDDALDTLPMDLQQMGYLWVTTQELSKFANEDPSKGLSIEYPTGVVMNIVRRPGHRRGVNESLKVFLDRVADEVRNPRKFDHNFIRYEMALSPSEITGWKKSVLDPLMMAVRQWWEGSLPHYMNHNALITKYGRCGLFLPIVKGDFSNCYRRTKAFGEL